MGGNSWRLQWLFPSAFPQPVINGKKVDFLPHRESPWEKQRLHWSCSCDICFKGQSRELALALSLLPAPESVILKQ